MKRLPAANVETDEAVEATQLLDGPAVLRLGQVRQLLQAPDRRTHKGKRDAALLAVLVGGGLRVGEASRLTVGEVEQTTTGRLRLTFKTAKSRIEKLRTVSLPGWAAVPVSGWLEESQPKLWLFPGNREEHLTVRAV